MHVCQFESLPNEILVEIFEYIDARDLFQAFDDLNLRLTNVLHSLDQLHFIPSMSSNINERFTPYLHTLIINDRVTINLHQFSTVHRLKILTPTYEQLKQLTFGHFLHLEHLFIGYQKNHFSLHMPKLYEKIFSHGFPNLITCDLFEPHLIREILSPRLCPSLHSLKLEAIPLSTYRTLLSICPNLHLFQFTAIDSSEKPSHFHQHVHLRHITIKYFDFLDVLNDGDIDDYLSMVPNLESLTLH